MRLRAGGAALLFAAALALLGCERRTATTQRDDSAQDAYRQPDRLIAGLGLKSGDAVAEIGAGGGYLTGRLAASVAPSGRVVATDTDESALAALRQRTAGLKVVETKHVTADQPGLGTDRFDLILLSHVDHLLPDRTAYLRALRPSLLAVGRIAVVNGQRHHDAVKQAATDAGYRVEEIAVQLPGQFLLLLWPRSGGRIR